MISKKIVAELVSQKGTTCYQDFYKLFTVLLAEKRRMNDTARIDEVPKLQGEIRLLNRLLTDLNPKPLSKKVYDGGFGE